MYNSVTDEAMALDAFDFESNLFGDFDTDQTNTSMAQSHTNAAPGTLPDTSGVQGESLLGPDTQLDSGLVGMDWSHISAADPSLLSIMSSTGEASRSKHEISRTGAALDGRRDSSPYAMTVVSRIEFNTPWSDSRSSGTNSASRSSVETIDTQRTSTTSMDSGHASFEAGTNATAMTHDMSTPVHAHPPGIELICPPCNMGDGHVTRPYIRNGSTPAETISPDPRNTIQYQNTYRKPQTFDKHIKEWHRRMFMRSRSTQFVCVFCPCVYPCWGRFLTEHALLDHLRSAHAHFPEQLEHTHHVCAALAENVVGMAV